jgi:hypothetical protein
MPATTIFKQSHRDEIPIATQAEISDNGLINCSATFALRQPRRLYDIGDAIRPSVFSSLSQINVQGIIVQSSSLEKRNGLWTQTIGAVGVINPPVFVKKSETAPGSFSKTLTINFGGLINALTGQPAEPVTRVGGFDYLATTESITVIYLDGNIIEFTPKQPQLIDTFNKYGDISILTPGATAPSGGSSILAINQQITATIDFVNSQSIENNNGIVTHTKTKSLRFV